MAPIQRLLTWLLGPTPRLREVGNSGPLLVMVLCVGVISMWLDTKHTFNTPGAEDSWTLMAYGCLPLAAVICWQLRGAKSFGIAILVSVVAIVAPLLMRVASSNWSGSISKDAVPLLLVGVTGSVVLVALALHEGVDLEEWGLGVGDWRWWLPRFALAAVLMEVMVIGIAWWDPEIRTYYPEYGPAKTSAWQLARYQAWLGIYMLGWECFFRGIFLQGVAKRGDVLFAVMVPSIPFFLLHWHKPEIEMLSAFVGSVGACWFCLNARSFWPVFLLHWAMNLSMEVTCFAWRNLTDSIPPG